MDSYEFHFQYEMQEITSKIQQLLIPNILRKIKEREITAPYGYAALAHRRLNLFDLNIKFYL